MISNSCSLREGVAVNVHRASSLGLAATAQGTPGSDASGAAQETLGADAMNVLNGTGDVFNV